MYSTATALLLLSAAVPSLAQFGFGGGFFGGGFGNTNNGWANNGWNTNTNNNGWTTNTNNNVWPANTNNNGWTTNNNGWTTNNNGWTNANTNNNGWANTNTWGNSHTVTYNTPRAPISARVSSSSEVAIPGVAAVTEPETALTDRRRTLHFMSVMGHNPDSSPVDKKKIEKYRRLVNSGSTLGHRIEFGEGYLVHLEKKILDAESYLTFLEAEILKMVGSEDSEEDSEDVTDHNELDSGDEEESEYNSADYALVEEESSQVDDAGKAFSTLSTVSPYPGMF